MLWLLFVGFLPVSLAIFDLDNTLLAGDSDHAWGQFLVDRGLVDADHYRSSNDRFFHQYQNGELDVHAYLAFALEPLTRHSLEELSALHAEFMREVIAPMRLHRADQLLAEHRERGDFLLIITATNTFVTRPIAEALGVDDLIATDPELLHGRYTGRVQGTPSFREGKVERLRTWLAERGADLAGASFYSDSHNDLPLLELVEKPVVVDPDPTLYRVAIERGWPVMSLRD